MSRGRAGAVIKQVAIVVPTYREADNVTPLIERIAATMEHDGRDWELVISDDQSDDGTAQRARKAGAGLPVRVFVRESGARELCANALHGIGHTNAPIIVVMDGDLSHRPEDIPRLINALGDDVEMAIGSRYLRGAKIDHRWSRQRRCGSIAATLAARTLWRTSDPLSGFFAVKRRAMPPPTELAPIGYKIALELAVRGRMRTTHIPISFDQRHAGESKMDAREVVRYARHLTRLVRHRHQRSTRLVCFASVGLSGFAIDVAVYISLAAAGVEHRIARIASFIPAATSNWALNRKITFAERPKTSRAHQWARSMTSSAASALINIGTYITATGTCPWLDAHRLWALALGVAVAAAMNFAINHKWVYRA